MNTTPTPFAAPLQEALQDFFDYHPPHLVSQRLRMLLLDFLILELKAGIPIYLPELLADLSALFQVLDTAAETLPQPTN